MEKYHGTVQNALGRALTAMITVDATVYEDNETTVKTQPFNSNSEGEFSFKAPNGEYVVTMTASGVSDTRTIRLFDADDAGIVSVKDYGALGDGSTDDTAAITAAIAASLGKRLFFPKGTYLTDGISVASLTGVHISGEDKYSTIIKSNTGVNDHVIAYSGTASDCSIENITIDQNRSGKTGGHGIRLGGVDGLTIRNVRIKSCYSYGIGVQASTNTNVLIDGFEIWDTGQDGIDIKDFDSLNENIIITNGIIRDYGDNATGQVAFDIRGPAVVSNIQIAAENSNNRGFRLRVEGAQGRAGTGTVSNINILLSGSGSYGFNAEGASNNNLTVSNVVVRGGTLGVIGSTGGLFKNLTGYGAAASEALSVAGIDNDIDGLVIDGALRGIDFEAGATGNRVRGFNIKNLAGTEAARIQSTADNNALIDGVIQSGKTIPDSGSGTIIRNVRNWKTSANLISSDLLVDSTGTKTATIAHGLAVTPNPEDVSISVLKSTGSPTDYRIGLLHIDGNPTSTNVVARAVVTTASGTTGAAIKLVATVRAKNS